jgi:hypothetical protein
MIKKLLDTILKQFKYITVNGNYKDKLIRVQLSSFKLVKLVLTLII